MDILHNKTDDEIISSVLAEVAKARHEIRCSQGDINKAQSRLTFLIMAVNELLNRTRIDRHENQ